VTALWCTLVTFPNLIFLHTAGDRIGPMAQLTVVYVVAVLVGARVDREAAARALARAATHALESSEARYRGVFEAVRDGMLVLDNREIITAANAAADAICGRGAGELVGQMAADLLPTPLLERLRGALSDGGPEDAIAVPGPDGVTRWVVPVAQGLGDHERSRIVLFRDVTEQRRQHAMLEQFAGEMLRTQEEERQRIAQELHDDTVQSLVLVCRRLDAITEERGARASPREREQLRALRSYTESSLASLRDYLRGLRPSALDDLGLVAAIRRLASEPEPLPGMRVEFEANEETQRLPPEPELVLYRIAQEALRNAQRHSGAKHVTVALRFGRAVTELIVSDDGSGFDASARASQNGLGLRGMEERARHVGGTLTIRSTPGQGTTITARVPHSSHPVGGPV
jgi:PAS domain S-box-containing protein